MVIPGRVGVGFEGLRVWDVIWVNRSKLEQRCCGDCPSCQYFFLSLKS